jgi:outer membrane protein OmpA-like peptidoglycan-associated protein
MTDLMASVAVTFLLIAAIFMLRAAGAHRSTRQALKRVEVVQKQSLEALDLLVKDLGGNADLQGRVLRDPKDRFVVTIEFPEKELYFKSGSPLLETGSKDKLIGPLQVVVSRVCDIDSSLTNSIVLEGHADREGTYQENVSLSARRAETVYFEVRSRLDRPATEWTRRCIDSRITVSGRGYVQPKSYPSDRWDDPLRPWKDPTDRRVILKVRFTSGGEQLQNPT